MKGLDVLIVTGRLQHRAGIELYTHDLAIELQALGHVPRVYTPTPGPVSDAIRAQGVTVVDSLFDVDRRPDVIHGNSTVETIAALAAHPGVPAVYVNHDITYWNARVPVHTGIRRFVGVGDTNERYIRETAGIDATLVRVVQNGVDLARFAPRAPLPASPRRALYFSNYETSGGAVAEACERLGIALHVVGLGTDRSTADPAELLRDADLVFAKARCALEALAVGCAVVVAHRDRLGPMVTASGYPLLRAQNFGLSSFTEALDTDSVIRQIKRYDPVDATSVRDVVRDTASVPVVTRELVAVYREAIADAHSGALDPRWGADLLIELGRAARSAEQLDLRGERIGELEGRLRITEHDLAGLRTEHADALEDLGSHREHLARSLAELDALNARLAAAEAEAEQLRTERAALADTRTMRLRQHLLGSSLAGRAARALLERRRSES